MPSATRCLLECCKAEEEDDEEEEETKALLAPGVRALYSSAVPRGNRVAVPTCSAAAAKALEELGVVEPEAAAVAADLPPAKMSLA